MFGLENLYAIRALEEQEEGTRNTRKEKSETNHTALFLNSTMTSHSTTIHQCSNLTQFPDQTKQWGTVNYYRTV